MSQQLTELTLPTSKHTPGPWRFILQKNPKPEYSTTWHIDSKTRSHMAVMTVWDISLKHASAESLKEHEETMAEVEANAHLIAAAPELLETLIKALQLLRAHESSALLLAEIETTIQKAMGGKL